MPQEHGPSAEPQSATHYLARLRELTSASPDVPAVSCDGRTISRAELLSGIGGGAGALATLGVARGQTVALCLPNSIEFVQAAFATYALGAVPLLLPVGLTSHERAQLIELAGPATLIGFPPAGHAGHRRLSQEEFRHAAELGPHTPLTPVLAPYSRITASGGSTGRPKLIEQLSAPTTESALQAAAALRLVPSGTALTPVPFSHSGPFITMLAALLSGNHLITTGDFEEGEVLRRAAHHRVDHVYLTPTMMLRIWRLPQHLRDRTDLSALRTLFHVGAPCPAWLKRAYIDWLGPTRVLESYGTSEAVASTMINGVDWLTHPGSVGRPVMGRIEARDAGGQRCAPGEVGELWMAGPPNAAPTYRYIGPEPEYGPDGWASPGDIGYVDADGYVHITDRKADMILVGGVNVYPAEIEGALDSHPAVLSSAVIGLPDEVLGNVPHAFVELSEPVDDMGLLDHLTRLLAAHKLPHAFERVHAPLRDSAGKLRRYHLRAQKLAPQESQERP